MNALTARPEKDRPKSQGSIDPDRGALALLHGYGGGCT